MIRAINALVYWFSYYFFIFIFQDMEWQGSLTSFEYLYRPSWIEITVRIRAWSISIALPWSHYPNLYIL